MHVVWGTDLYGTVDKVPGFFSVGTRFFHVYHVPLVPEKSFVVLKREGKHFSGVEIPLDRRSVLMAYGVGFLPAVWVLAGICVALRLAMSPKDGVPVVPAAIAIAALLLWLAFMAVSLTRKADYATACRLGQIAGLNEVGWEKLNERFGRKGDRMVGA